MRWQEQVFSFEFFYCGFDLADALRNRASFPVELCRTNFSDTRLATGYVGLTGESNAEFLAKKPVAS
jgi:hypothetical protein